MERKKKYLTEEERKAARRKQVREAVKRWRENNPEKDKEWRKQWREENSDYRKEKQKEYNKTPMGRAVYLIGNYQQEDKKHNRGECTLTAQWIVENIFTSKCHWCKKTDWHKLGCDRIDNSLPHTEDNVVPCCEECNKRRGTKTYEEFLLAHS